MTPSTLINGTTSAVQSVYFIVDNQIAAVYSKGTIGGGESIDLQVEDDAGSWINVTDLNGADVALSATVSSIRVIGPGRFRLNKSATAAAAGAFVYFSG